MKSGGGMAKVQFLSHSHETLDLFKRKHRYK
jgi:hypothetical protein